MFHLVSRKIFKTKKFQVALFVLIFLFTFILRAHNFDRSPTMGNLEEMLYAWSGIYLVETGVPVSWSTLDYPKRAEVYLGTVDYKGGEPKGSVTLYKPWLDEPPVFSLIVGWFGHINNANRTDWIPTGYIRTPVVLMAAITSILVFLVARLVAGYWIGILSMLVYGTVPIIVLASRLAVPENLIAMTFMLMVYLLLKFNNNARFIYLLPIPLLVGISGLSKPTGFFLLPLALYIVWTKKYYRWMLYLVIASLPFIGFFFWYGLHFDAEIFWRITSIQAFRPVGFKSLAWFFTSPSYDWRMITDSWYVFCLLAAAYFIFSPQFKEKRLLVLSFVYWVAVVMVSGGEGDLLAWYRFPAFPSLAILGALGLAHLVQNISFFTTFLAGGLLLGSRSLLVNAFQPNIEPGQYRAIFSGLMLPSIVNMAFPRKRLETFCKVLVVVIIIVGIYLNVRYIYNEYELSCQSITCAFGPQNVLATLHFPVIWRFIVTN